jgi:hypothetical protein
MERLPAKSLEDKELLHSVSCMTPQWTASV